MVQIYYVKANRSRDWIFNNQQTDWDNFPLDETQEFATHTRKQLYWKSARKGDLIICHSSYISSHRKGDTKPKYSPLPRISAIAKVEDKEHPSKKLVYAVTLKKIEEFYPIQVTNEWIRENKLQMAEPFHPGSNRCTITKLTVDEFKIILGAIIKANPDKKDTIRTFLKGM